MEKLVIVGNGMAGVACLEQILKHRHDFDITVFGDETHVNHNRIMLSSVLAGECDADDIVINGLEWYQSNGIALRMGLRIVDIDPEYQTLTGDDGSITQWDKIILATGSSPFIPNIPGVDKKNVLTFRSLEDTRSMMSGARPGLQAAVIGGGLLGLEAARGLQIRGCDVTVVHLADTLMNTELDATGGLYLRQKIEDLGVRVLTGRRTQSLSGNGKVEGVVFEDGEKLGAELVVIAAGIRPNADLGHKAGLVVNRGIVVNDHMETSDPRIVAVGECTEHRGQIFGLVSPLLEQGKVLAATITGNKGPEFLGWKPAAKLKIMGVEVFRAGETREDENTRTVRYEDTVLGVYKKVIVRGKQLAGVVLVGDTTSSNRYMEWLRAEADVLSDGKNLLFPEATTDKGASVAEVPDSFTVCGCMGVTKGQIISAIHEKRVHTMAQLKECTRASSGCGSCAGVCGDLLRAVVPEFVEETRKVLCKCVAFTQDQLREIIQTQRLKSVQEVLDIYGDGKGCEICKPALSYLVDVVSCGTHQEDRSARFINDRVHANIQKDGTFSVIPRIRGGVTSAAELRRIADVADKYQVPLVKITGSQRIDLLGVKKEDLPKMWADLGMPSGQGYTKGVRMVKTCVGTEFCRFGVQDAIEAGIELERRLENLYTPHKTKMGVTGCPRNCAEVTVKDIGLVGQEGSWQVVVGGAAGKSVRKADLLITVLTTEEALSAASLFFQYYRENGNYLERTYDFVERVGIENIRKQTVYATAQQKKDLLKRLQKSKMLSKDAWLERYEPANKTQFVQIQPIENPALELVQ
jgi:nitrite reductase (NADH) large subunit